MYCWTRVCHHQQVAVLISTILRLSSGRKWLCGRVHLESCLYQSANPVWIHAEARPCTLKRGTFQATLLFCVSCRSSAVSSWRSSERLSRRSWQQRWPQPGQNSWLTCAAASQLSTRKRAGLSCRQWNEGLWFTGSGDSIGRWIQWTDLSEECRISFERGEWSSVPEDYFGIMQQNLQRKRERKVKKDGPCFRQGENCLKEGKRYKTLN